MHIDYRHSQAALRTKNIKNIDTFEHTSAQIAAKDDKMDSYDKNTSDESSDSESSDSESSDSESDDNS